MTTPILFYMEKLIIIVFTSYTILCDHCVNPCGTSALDYSYSLIRIFLNSTLVE